MTLRPTHQQLLMCVCLQKRCWMMVQLLLTLRRLRLLLLLLLWRPPCP